MQLSVTEYICLGIIFFSVIATFAFLLIGHIGSHHNNQNYNKPVSTNAYYQSIQSVPSINITHKQTFPGNYAHSYSVQPNILFHGTTLKNALSIYKTGLWKVGRSKPYAVWMGDKLDIARQYSGTGSNAAIVVMQADPNINLSDYGSGVYIYEIPDAKPNEEYYRINGLTPIDVIDPRGNSILQTIL